MLRYDGSMFIECVRPIRAANPPDHRSQWGLIHAVKSPLGLEGDSPDDTNTSPLQPERETYPPRVSDATLSLSPANLFSNQVDLAGRMYNKL